MQLTTAPASLRSLDLLAGRGISLVRGEGCALFDSDGRSYVDLVSNYGVNVLGHAHPAVTAAVTAQAATLTSAHQSFDSPVRDDFLAALGALVPAELSRACFVNSGAEALEVAIKLSRVSTARTRIVAMNRGYHGRTMGALSLTADAGYRDPFVPLLPDVRHIAYDDLEALELIDERVAAVVVEPIQGEAGVRVPSDGYLRALRERCTAVGALLVADEVQTGFRTGAILRSVADGVIPDVVCLGKGIANGLPMAVTLCTEDVGAHMPRGGHGTTFAGSPLVCAAGVSTLEVLADPALHAQVTRNGDATMERLRELPSSVMREVRGRGLMIGVELRRPATPAIIELQRRGVLVLAAGRTVIRLLPPLIIDAATLSRAVAEIVEVVSG
jgi:acetylornithine/LysW-gamma-L-lysine aminotransferase